MQESVTMWLRRGVYDVFSYSNIIWLAFMKSTYPPTMHIPGAKVVSFTANNGAIRIILLPDNTPLLIYEATWMYFDEHQELYRIILKVPRCLSFRLSATSVSDFNLNDCNGISTGTIHYYNVRFGLCFTVCILFCISNVKC